MPDYLLFSGSKFDMYLGDVGATAPTITPATGEIAPAPASWAPYGSGKFPQDMMMNNQDVRQEIMTAGGRGMADGERRTLRGALITGGLWDASMESYAETWGNDITETAAGSGQVGIKTQNLDLDLNVKDHGILIVVTSQYGGGDDKWGGLIYLPKGSLMLGEVPFATTPATTAFTAKQFAHSTDGFWQMVTADAT